MKESIADNLADTVASIDNISLPAEILDFSIDQVLDEGLLKDIPGFGWIVKGIAAICSISDVIFYNKIVRFLFALEQQPQAKKRDCQAMIRVDVGYRRRVGEHLILLIDKLDCLQKAEILAKCFRNFLDGHIDHDRFMDLSHVVSRSSLADLKALRVTNTRQVVFRDRGLAASSGILEYGIKETYEENAAPELGTKFSKLGTDLRDILLDRLAQRIEEEKAQRKVFEDLMHPKT